MRAENIAVADAELAEELNPIGCAKFTSEKVSVMACIQTKDQRAIGRARASQQIRETPKSRRPPAGGA